MRDMRRALGRVVSQAAKDTGTKVDNELIYLRVLADLDEPHVRLKTVQARLRHASAKTTLDTYGHIWPDRDESTRAAIDAVITARTEQRRNSDEADRQRRRSGPV